MLISLGQIELAKDLKKEGADYARFLENLSAEKIAEGNRKNHQETIKEYQEFKDAFKKGQCYLCRKSIRTFSKALPCIHWLLKPKGFKNKDIELIAQKFGYFQIQSLLRWYANEEAFARNINDLKDEGTGKLFEATIKYKNLEWSFSCSESDYQGHAGKAKGSFPHYHFQMRIDKRPFINFNRNHMPFSDMDIVNIEAMRARPDKIKQRYPFGEGISDTLSDETIEQVLNSVSSTENEGEAAYSIDSLVMAHEGSSIRGEDLHNIIEEAKEKGVTVASLLHKLPNSSTEVIIGPGPGVAEQAPRSSRKKAHNKSLQEDASEAGPSE